ncbi:MAG: ParB N-terminal domain-containing protein [Fimbriiglobus sp.]
MKVQNMPVTALIPAPYNPRKPLAPNSPAYQKLKQGLVEFGLVEPLVWNETSGHLVGGHARLAILRELGWQTIPVVVVNLEENREKALNLLLNNLEAQGRYDPAKLAEVLQSLQGLPELEMTGFDEGMLQNLQFEPPTEPPIPESQDVCLEVVLRLPEERYQELEATLNDFITTHHLQAHVRRTE